MVHWVRCNWLTVLALCSLCAEAEKRLSDSHLTGMAKLRCTLLKRPADLPEDDGDGRKKVALNALGEKTADVASFLDPLVESNGEEKTECGAVVVAIDKGKAKAKVPKRKLRSSEPPNTGPGRVATRGDTKKNEDKNLVGFESVGRPNGFFHQQVLPDLLSTLLSFSSFIASVSARRMYGHLQG